MSNSEFVLKNPEGKSVKFNFQLENGLPVKPIINPAYDLMRSKSTKKFSLYIYI